MNYLYIIFLQVHKIQCCLTSMILNFLLSLFRFFCMQWSNALWVARSAATIKHKSQDETSHFPQAMDYTHYPQLTAHQVLYKLIVCKEKIQLLKGYELRMVSKIVEVFHHLIGITSKELWTFVKFISSKPVKVRH